MTPPDRGDKEEKAVSRIIPTLWFDHDAEAAAHFYVSLLPDSRVEQVNRAPLDVPGRRTGEVLTVILRLAGQRVCLLNGGPSFPHSQAFSMMIETEDQAETDRLWQALTADGGEPNVCGWCRDRWGVFWQVTPRRLLELMADPDPARARRAMEAMMTMARIDIAALEAAVAPGPR
jgi:predicted 3-demethylubiquinone-9 3-methyltransferase (glyoxalase superfamily)